MEDKRVPEESEGKGEEAENLKVAKEDENKIGSKTSEDKEMSQTFRRSEDHLKSVPLETGKVNEEVDPEGEAPCASAAGADSDHGSAVETDAQPTVGATFRSVPVEPIEDKPHASHASGKPGKSKGSKLPKKKSASRSKKTTNRSPRKNRKRSVALRSDEKQLGLL